MRLYTDALLWHLQGGCIIRAVFLDDIYQAYTRNPALENLMVDPEFAKKLVSSSSAWRSVIIKVGLVAVASVTIKGVPTGATGQTGLRSIHDCFSTARPPNNLFD